MTTNELYDKYLAACRIDKKCIFNQLTEDQIKLLFEKLLSNSYLHKCLVAQPFLFFRRNHTKLLNDEINLILENEFKSANITNTKGIKIISTDENQKENKKIEPKIESIEIINNINSQQQDEREQQINNLFTKEEKKIENLDLLDDTSITITEVKTIETKRKRGRPRKTK